MTSIPREEPEARARHAEVVPAFIALNLRRPLDGWTGPITPMELIRWERKADLADSIRNTLRKTIVKRTRVRAEQLWSQPVGVRLDSAWRDRLAGHDRKRAEQLAAAAESKPLEVWTLREVKDLLHLPLEHTLALLARLEALYWVPPLPPARRVDDEHLEPNSTVPVTDELRELANKVLSLSWVAQVTHDDLRFAFAEEAVPFPNWVQVQLAKVGVPTSFSELMEQLLAADSLTAEEEVQALARRAAQDCVPRAGGAESAQRWVAIFLMRRISRTGPGRTLKEVGDAYGVTRERIRQLCQAFEDEFAECSAITPALDRVLRAAARVAPSQVDEVDEQLRRFIGDGAGLESLCSWAEVLGKSKLPVVCRRTRTSVRGKFVEITMVERPDAPSWVPAMIRHVSRDTSMFGCTNVLRIAGRLALKECIAPGQEAIEAALEAATGFRWLDKESGWFTLGDVSTCSAASRVRKIVAVAHDTVGTDEIAAAFASDDQWIYRDSNNLGLATPPVHVLRELFIGWPWLRVVQRGRFVAADGFDAAGVLSDAEQVAVDVITAHDGVACRFELKEAVMERLGLTNMLVTAMLGSSPIIERLEHGLYRLLGRRVGDGAVNAARIRLRERAVPNSAALPTATAPNEYFARVTEASLRNEQYHVPERFRARLAGKPHRVFSHSGELLGEARVTQSGALTALNRLFPEVAAGDIYRITLLDDCMSVQLQEFKCGVPC